ncbi:MAG TPA: hypothetical protein VGA95_05520 [Thermodesulfobacteriota bacterium]|jgi:hypothetical protein
MRKNNEPRSVYDLEPICMIISRYSIEQPDEKKVEQAVEGLLSDFKLIKTINPLIWIFVGRWRAEITDKNKDRISRLTDRLKSVDGNSFVIPSFTWTNILKQHELAWKTWRELIS